MLCEEAAFVMGFHYKYFLLVRVNKCDNASDGTLRLLQTWTCRYVWSIKQKDDVVLISLLEQRSTLKLRA